MKVRFESIVNLNHNNERLDSNRLSGSSVTFTVEKRGWQNTKNDRTLNIEHRQP